MGRFSNAKRSVTKYKQIWACRSRGSLAGGNTHIKHCTERNQCCPEIDNGIVRIGCLEEIRKIVLSLKSMHISNVMEILLPTLRPYSWAGWPFVGFRFARSL